MSGRFGTYISIEEAPAHCNYSKPYGHFSCDTWLPMMLLVGTLHEGQRRILHRSNAITSAIKHAVL
jgi:hypothetical protein